jgi:AcrR family transcriptional regulator
MTGGPPQPDRATSPRRPRGDAARAKLFDAALKAFANHGFHGTGTREIAAEAGMSGAAMYVHHRSKEELLFAIAMDGHQQALSAIEAGAALHESPAERLASAVWHYTVWHARAHTNALVVQHELGALSAVHAREVFELRRTTEARLRQIVADGVTSGDFEVLDLTMTSLALLSLGIDVARWYRESGVWTPEEIGDHYSQLALRMVGHHPRGRPARR